MVVLVGEERDQRQQSRLLSHHCPPTPTPMSVLSGLGPISHPPMSQVPPCALIFPSLSPQVPLLALCRASTHSSRLISPACLSFRPLEISPSFPKPDRNTSHLSCVSAVSSPFPRQTQSKATRRVSRSLNQTACHLLVVITARVIDSRDRPLTQAQTRPPS